MDTLTTAEVGLGSAALTTALIAWLKNLGLAPSQKVILIWAMVIPIGVQVLLVLANVTPVTTQAVAAAVIAGITSGLAAGGLHDHASAAAAKVKTNMESVKAAVTAANQTPDPEGDWETAKQAYREGLAAGTFTQAQVQVMGDGLLTRIHAVFPYAKVPNPGAWPL